MTAMQYNGMNRRLLESDILYSEYAVQKMRCQSASVLPLPGVLPNFLQLQSRCIVNFELLFEAKKGRYISRIDRTSWSKYHWHKHMACIIAQILLQLVDLYYLLICLGNRCLNSKCSLGSILNGKKTFLFKVFTDS